MKWVIFAVVAGMAIPCLGICVFLTLREHRLATQDAFNEAASRGDVIALDRLWRRGAHVTESSNPAIERAVNGGHREAVAWLLEHGADPTETDYEGYSMLWIATRGDHPDAECETLLKNRGGKFIPPPHDTPAH